MENKDNPYEFYEETRKYPRIKIKIPVQVCLNNGQSITANIFDVSPDGIQIRCRRDRAIALNPAGKRIDKKDNISVKAVFSLPIENEQKQIAVDCLIYYFVIVPGELEEDIAFGYNLKKLKVNRTSI